MTILTTLLIAAAFAQDASAAKNSAKAAVRLKGTAEGSPITGAASLEETKNGLQVTVTVEGAPVGEHGLHIHEFGSCDEGGKAAGSHYNPKGAPHGDAAKDAKHAHPGDLGNITVGADGKGRREAVLPHARLAGKRSVAGRSIILHEKADDFSQPTGNAGGRIACGLIGLAP